MIRKSAAHGPRFVLLGHDPEEQMPILESHARTSTTQWNGTSSMTAPRDTRVFRVPLSVRIGSLIGTTICAAVPVFLFAVTLVAMLKRAWVPALIGLACAVLMTAVARYVLRDFVGKWRFRIALGIDTVTLDLAAGRSLIHRPPAQHLTFPYADIVAVETRLEGYRTMGMAVMQRAYVLRRRDDTLIFLFEERALATGFASSMFGGIAGELAARVGTSVKDLGMAEGDGGVLAVWGTHAPDWAAPALSPERQRSLWARAAATGAAAAAGVSAASGAWLGGFSRRRPGSEPPPQ
jgi:hypothetical protein